MEDSDRRQQPASDVKYLIVVSGLLMSIVILLSVLWLRERRDVAALGAELRIARQGAMNGQFKGALARMLAGQAEPPALGLQREDLPAETVTWNGQARTVLRVSATAGERLGLIPGDVVLVAPPPASQPTTRPGS